MAWPPTMMFMSLVIFLFAFSSILGNYAHANGNFTYLGASVPVMQVLRGVVLLAVTGGSLCELPTVRGLPT